MFKRKDLFAGLALVALASACGTSASESIDEDGQTASATAALDPEPTVCNQGADPPGISVRWVRPVVGAMSAALPLSSFVTNRTSSPVHVHVEIKASIPRGYSTSWTLYDGTVAANSETPLSLTLGSIPMRATDAAVRAELVSTVDDAGNYAGLRFVSPPLYLKGNSGYSTFNVLGEDPPPAITLSAPTTFAQAVDQIATAAATLGAASTSAQYLYQSPAGGPPTWRSVTVGLTVPGGAYNSPKHGSVLSPADSASMGNFFGPTQAPPINSAYAPIIVCAKWPARFVDDVGGGAEYPASHAEAFIGVAGQAPVWSGNLDSSGCTPPLPLLDYTSYALGLLTRHHYTGLGSNPSLKVLGAGGEIETGVVGFSTLQVNRPSSSGTVYIMLGPFSPETNATRVAAVGSVILRKEGPRLPASDYVVRTKDGCGTTSSACYKPDSKELWLGPMTPETNPTVKDDHNSKYRFVVAHEFGHAVQDAAFALSRPGYDTTLKTDSSICGCGFVADQYDRLHCLGARESHGVAETEGFGHYFAARVWNGTDPNDCTFMYYKNFKEGTQILHPPVPRSCSQKVRWFENNCFQPGKASEWDWMNFQRALSVQSQAIGLDDLLDVYRTACSGNCNGQEPTFATLAAATVTKYGSNAPQVSNFNALATAYGVDN